MQNTDLRLGRNDFAGFWRERLSRSGKEAAQHNSGSAYAGRTGYRFDKRKNRKIFDIDFLSRCIKCRVENKDCFFRMGFLPGHLIRIRYWVKNTYRWPYQIREWKYSELNWKNEHPPMPPA